LASAILLTQLGCARGEVELAQSSIDPVNGRAPPSAAYARLSVDDSHEPHRQANGKRNNPERADLSRQSGMDCRRQKIAMKKRHAAFLS
jgi:hypothetical protein